MTLLPAPRRSFAWAWLLLLAACGGDRKEEAAPAGPAAPGDAKKSPLAPKEPPTYAVRHILVASKEAPAPIRKDRTKDEAKRKAADLAKRLQADPRSFDAVAREVSDDPTTAPDGGFFGFMSKESGEIPALVEVAEKLAEGQVSAPVETQFGWHVMQRLSRAEGRRIEEAVSAVVDGFVVVWEGLERGVPASQTKDVAYAVAAKAVHEIRGGEDLQRTAAKMQWTHEFYDVYRTAPKPGFEKLGDAARALKVGEMSDPVETRAGWVVVVRQPYLRCYLRHIVIGHQVSLVREPPPRGVADAKALAEEAAAMVKDRSRWQEAVLIFSDEPASKAMGGYMGDVTNAGISQRRVPTELEAALLKLKPDEISGVVESRLGFHVLWRVD